MIEAAAAMGRTETLWSPRASQIARSELAKFIASTGGSVMDYATFHAWSTSDLEGFWGALWSYANVIGYRGKATLGRGNDQYFRETTFFPEARINLTENLLNGDAERAALKILTSSGSLRTFSNHQLLESVRRVAAGLKQAGIKPGDVICADLPNQEQRVTACLACLSVGAVWAHLPKEQIPDKAVAQLAALQPKLAFFTSEEDAGAPAGNLKQLIEIAPSFHTLVTGAGTGPSDTSKGVASLQWEYFEQCAPAEKEERFPFDHPAVVYVDARKSDPCVWMHSTGGVLLTHVKEHLLHGDIKRSDIFIAIGDRTPEEWMWDLSSLACAQTLVLCEASESVGHEAVWRSVESTGATHLAVGAQHIGEMASLDYAPNAHANLERLRAVFVDRGTLPPKLYDWIRQQIGSRAMLSPSVGDTATLAKLFLGSPLHPVRRGQFPARALGMALHIIDDRNAPVIARQGDLVCSEAFPSMPITTLASKEGIECRLHRHPGFWSTALRAKLTAYGSGVSIEPDNGRISLSAPDLQSGKPLERLASSVAED
jgi:acetoacetyl-CoA synthetase